MLTRILTWLKICKNMFKIFPSCPSCFLPQWVHISLKLKQLHIVLLRPRLRNSPSTERLSWTLKLIVHLRFVKLLKLIQLASCEYHARLLNFLFHALLFPQLIKRILFGRHQLMSSCKIRLRRLMARRKTACSNHVVFHDCWFSLGHCS